MSNLNKVLAYYLNELPTLERQREFLEPYYNNIELYEMQTLGDLTMFLYPRDMLRFIGELPEKVNIESKKGIIITGTPGTVF